MTLEEIAEEQEAFNSVIGEYLKTRIYEKVLAPIDPNWTYVQRVKEPKPKQSIDDLLDQGYSLRQIQQILKGEN